MLQQRTRVQPQTKGVTSKERRSQLAGTTWTSRWQHSGNCRGHESDPWSGKILGEGNGTPLQCSCLKNPVARGAWRAAVHRGAQADTTEATYHACTGEENGSPLQCSCLENTMDRAWWAAVHGVAQSRTRLSNLTFTFHFHALEKEMATHSSCLQNPRDGGA